jgi:hypothetical protein
MTFRLLRLFMLRFLPRRMFAFLTLIELALMARKVYRSATSRTPATGPKTVLRPVDVNDVDTDVDDPEPVVIDGSSRRI